MSHACPTSAEIDQFLRAADDQIQADSRLHAIQLHILDCSNCLEQMESAVLKAVGMALPDNSSAFLGLATTRAESVDLAPKIEGFVMGDRLGRGGMGTVFKAWQTAMHREVAIKVLPGGPLADPRWRAWCLAEARAAAQVRHPDAVQVHDVGMTAGYPYLVMEYVAGGSLAHRLRQRPAMSFRDACRLLARIARAVHHMHLRGLIHRDLKPGNILIDSPSDAPPSGWWPKVADFGLARPIGGPARSLTLAGIGTPEYLAPELAQGRGSKVEPLSDIYALGAILYHLLVGRPPFQEASPQETLARVIEGNPAPPRKIARNLPHDLETIVLKCLEREPQLRYTTAEALANDLDLFLGGRTILARPIGPVRRASRFARRHPIGSALMLGLTLTSATSMGLLVRAEVERSRAAASEMLALERSREAEASRAEAEANQREAERMFEAAGRLLSIVSRTDAPDVTRTEKSLADFEAAIPTCVELLRSRPADPELLHTMSRILIRVGERKALEGRPSQAAVLFREGTEAIDAALELTPDDEDLRHIAGDLHHWHGRMRYALQDFPAAIQSLRRSLELCDGPPGNRPLTRNQRFAAMLRTTIGPHLIWAGDDLGRRVLVEAKAMLEGHLEVEPDDLNALNHLANVYHYLKESDAELAARRRLVDALSNPSTRYALAQTLYLAGESPGDAGDRLRRAAEIVDLLDPCFSEFERNADEAPGNPNTASSLHYALTMSIVSLLDLGRSDEATDALERLISSVEARHVKIPGPERGIDSFYNPTISLLGQVLAHQNLSLSACHHLLDRIGLLLSDDRISPLARVIALHDLVVKMNDSRTEMTGDRIAAFVDMGRASIDRHLATEAPAHREILRFLEFSQACRGAGRLDDSEAIVDRCGEVLKAIPIEARDDPEYHAAWSEFWRQVAKNLWRHEPIDETALRDALERSLESAEEAARRLPTDRMNQMVADRRARLERSSLAPGAIAQNPVRKD